MSDQSSVQPTSSHLTRPGCLTIIAKPDQLRVANLEGYTYHLQRAFFRDATLPSDQQWDDEMRDYAENPAAYSVFALSGEDHRQRFINAFPLLAATKQAGTEALNTADPAQFSDADDSLWSTWFTIHINGDGSSEISDGLKLNGNRDDRVDRALICSGEPVNHRTVQAIPGFVWSQARDGSDPDGEWRRTIAFDGGEPDDESRRFLTTLFDAWARDDIARDAESGASHLPSGTEPLDWIHQRCDRLTEDFRGYLFRNRVAH